MYGLKVDVSVLLNKIAAVCTDYYPGSITDIRNMSEQISSHENLLKKTDYEMLFEDTGKQSEKYLENWAFLFNKGYQGASEFLCVIHPQRKVSNCILSKEEKHLTFL